MNRIFKQLILLCAIFFSGFLYADGTDTQITISDASGVHESNGPLQFTIKLSSAPWFSTVTVNYSTNNGSAKAGSDYTATSGSVTFMGFQTTKTIEVPILNDTIHENSENLSVTITNSDSGYVVTDNIGYGTIYDDDTAPIEAKIYNRYENEKDANWVLNFTVKLNQNAPNDITLDYTTIDNTAIAGDDYIASSGVVTIAKGSKYGYIPITIIGDTIPESTERFKVKISAISQGTITRDVATGTIKNDDAIKLYIKSSNTKEGNVGDHNKMPFTLYLKKAYPLDTPLTINYKTIDGSNPKATAGVDYTAKSGTVTFHKGDIEHIVYVSIIGDNDIEPNEYLKMKIWGSSYIKRSSTQSKIINDDGSFPRLSFKHSDFYIVEGNSSTRNLNFELKLNKPAIKGSSFIYYTKDSSAKVSDSDYQAISSKKHIFNGGERVVIIPVKINGDRKIESDELFYLKIKNPVKLKLSGSSKGHIINDDGSYPKINVNSSYSINEGDSGVVDLNFTMSLDKPALKGSSFRYYTEDSSAKVSDNDYSSISAKTYTFNGGERKFTIPVKINGDTKIEPNEEFYLHLDHEENLTISGTNRPKGIILNDDGEYPHLSINDVTSVEGNSSTKTFHFTITLDTIAGANVGFDYEVFDGDNADVLKNAKSPSDYIRHNGAVHVDLDENTTTYPIDVTINGDSKVEKDEQFYIKISNPKNLIISDNRGVGTITNDDIHSNEPFTCNSSMYISSSINRETSATGRMWLHEIDTTQNPFDFNVVDNVGASELYNALAYSEKDNYIYGLYHRELIKLTKTAKVINLGVINGLPSILDERQLYAGAIFNGYYFVTGPGVSYDKVFKINLADKNVTTITLSKSVSIQDFSFYYEGNATKYLYGIADGGKLTKIDTNTGAVTDIGLAHNSYQFDSTFSDKNGRFFANDSDGHGFFEFNIANGVKRFLSNSQPATYNDGANCINAELIFTDYGDAPISYGKTWHNISNGIFLGDNIDHDIGDYDTINADGDDINGIDDDDGVTLDNGDDINGTYFETNSTHNLKVKLSKDAYLKIWIDSDINGHFDNATDLIYNSGAKLTAGVHTINFFLPPNLTQNKKSYLRARVSSNPSMNPTGFVTDGEVEDYMIYFGTGVKPLKGVFNIERTDSGSFPIDSNERNAWFTQIVGRDFDYSLLFYSEDMSKEKELDSVTVKIELINEETNATLYTKYAYIKNTPPKSRIDNILPNDLNNIPATKKARFRIYYGVDSDNNIIQAPCFTDYKICFEALPNITFVDARDDFAIRPEYFHLILSDGNLTRRVNTSPNNNKPLRLSAGYDYNLTVTASSYNGTDINPSKDYNTSITRVLEFLDKTNIHCRVKDDKNSTESFIDGKNSTNLLKLQQVGKYRLKLKDDKWAKVDIEKGDCDTNKSYTSANGNTISGCNIVSNPDINISFYPYSFDVNLTIENLPNSSHNDFIYMSELNSTFNSVAIAYNGDITAKSEDNITTENFTAGCMAEDTLLNLVVTTMSDNGLDQPIVTTKGTAVNFTRVTKFNSESSVRVDNNQSFSNLPIINITKDKFRDDQNGTLSIDLRYNINKNLSETINPIQIIFHKVDVNSTNSYSLSNGKDEVNPYIPRGNQNLGNRVRNFYFAQVAPDKVKYPRVYFKKTDTLRTPMQIEIFCGNGVNNQYCIDTNLTSHIKVESSPRAELGWFLSIDHNLSVDGKVTALIPNNINPNVVQIRTASLPTMPIRFKNGRNGTVRTRFTNPNGTKKYRIDIYADPQLKYYGGEIKPTLPRGVGDYTVEGTENNSSTWTGVGKTGNLLEMKANSNSAHKMDW